MAAWLAATPTVAKGVAVVGASGQSASRPAPPTAAKGVAGSGRSQPPAPPTVAKAVPVVGVSQSRGLQEIGNTSLHKPFLTTWPDSYLASKTTAGQ